ncbi:MAG: A/G-specific adenine glycosylase [Candidatus Tokpelaia sp. JSC161]|jgi:A/G-specific adenine glycosylase|nr:MAG: A/G-specific adenine glycosylase [Candidatus Tokpelaia sp. JSC161]
MQKIASQLFKWYDQHHRLLPWRTTPSEQKQGIKADPYKIWLSEIMLQQTTVKTVKPYFTKFIQKWPNIQALSAASQEDILKEWSGLGYYSRARSLKSCADQILSKYNGQFPKHAEKLRALPGLGNYTAAAISAIAFNQKEAVVDSNVQRVITRLFLITTALPFANKEIHQYTRKITPYSRPGDFAQAMMDLGATLCTPKKPKCLICPLTKLCLALQKDNPENFPKKNTIKKKELRTGNTFIALSENQRIFLQKRHQKGLLGGMSETPNHFAQEANKQDMAFAPFPALWVYQGDIHHIFSHFLLSMSVYMATNLSENIGKKGWWVKIEDLTKEALPSLIKKAIKKALPDAFNL